MKEENKKNENFPPNYIKDCREQGVKPSKADYENYCRNRKIVELEIAPHVSTFEVEINSPTKEELYNHLANGYPIFFGNVKHFNDVAGKQLIPPDKGIAIHYEFKRDFSVVFKKNRMGVVGEVKYSLSQIKLIFK